MISKILTIKNVGLFSNGVPSKMTVKLDKATIIYAENGRGKSTLASILHACSLGDSGRVIARKTADSAGDPELRLVVQQASGNSQIVFQAGSWTASYREIMVFDSEFIDRNVYSGLEVRSDQRESLLEFALGDQAVILKNHFEDLTHEMEEETRKRSDSEKKLSGHMVPYQLQEFIALQTDEKIEEKIERKKNEFADANHAKSILQRKLPLSIPGLHFDFEAAAELLRSGLEDVATDAEATVRKHLLLHNVDEFEAWLSRGQSFLTQVDCPFCGQSLSGLDLISAYRSFFSRAYNGLKTRVAELAVAVEVELGDGRLEIINGAVRTNSALIDVWKDQVAVDLPHFDLDQLRRDLINIRTKIQALIAQKQDRPLDSIGTQEELEALSSRFLGLGRQVTAYNDCVIKIATKIEAFRQQLSIANTDTLKLELSRLEAVSRRYQPDVTLLVTQYQQADQRRAQIEGERKTVRNNLDTIMSTTLEQYQARVNDLLASFNMQIRIEQLKPSHKGKGNPRTEYGLLVRNKSVKLGSRDDTSNTHSFGTTLSEADKRTLAFAFFVARLEQDPQLNSRVIVLDDPVSSLDRNRRNQSITLIADLTTQCQQTVVLSHDAYFARDLRDRLSDLQPQPITPVLYKIQHAKDNYSAFTTCDIDDICASTYLRHYRLVNDYVNGNPTTNPRDVAKAIRPLLEGYLHKRFPDRIPRRMMFGTIIAEAKKATPPDPLVNLKKILGDLGKINEYASEFHHDTNPDADTVVVNETELHSYALSALNVIHKGG